MIRSYLLNKRVSWNTLERVRLTDGVHFFRKEHFGIVCDVTQCGGLLAIKNEANGLLLEVETWEVEIE
jgi:hypothetical protein